MIDIPAIDAVPSRGHRSLADDPSLADVGGNQHGDVAADYGRNRIQLMLGQRTAISAKVDISDGSASTKLTMSIFRQLITQSFHHRGPVLWRAVGIHSDFRGRAICLSLQSKRIRAWRPINHKSGPINRV